MGTSGSFLGVNHQVCDTDHSPPSSFKMMKSGAVPPLLYMSSWYGAELIRQRDNFTFVWDDRCQIEM
jgi:hypothetical protein